MFTKSWVSLALLLIVQTIGLGLFAKGFFPYKTNLSGFASPDDVPPLPEHGNATPKPSFDRLVFMLIDALRSDFVFGESSEMKFVQSLITNRHAIPFTALATAPTVTLPRIKALTTGTVPNFLDAILNIAESDTSTSLAYQDNWLVQFKNSANKSISFFGDDTWIKLFPGIFDRIDGTTSFFVSDTVEVDLNVTRNVIPQLARNDWDVLIFHYLGLDHVGHLGGPCSPLMTPKQQEMDKVVKVIYDTITEQDKERKRLNPNAKPTLFILGGDHGMNEAGNHGGSSAGEITTALVFMSSEYGLFKAVPPTFTIPHNVPYFQYYRVVNQVDLVPTLSYLFGIPIPKNSLGQMLLDVLSDHDVFDQLRALQLNAHQIAGILTSNWDSFNRLPDATVETTLDSNLHCAREENDRDILQCLYKVAYYYHALAVKNEDKNAVNQAIQSYQMFISEASSVLSATFSEYNLGSMSMGIGCILITVVCLTGVTMNSSRAIFNNRDIGNWKTIQIFSWIGIVLLAIVMFASSYVEEEHQFWYFWTQTMWVIWLHDSLKNNIDKKSFIFCIGQMLLVRLIRTWNQTGQKYAGLIDLKYYLNSSYAPAMWFMVFIVIIGLFLITLKEIWNLANVRSHKILVILQCLASLLVLLTTVLIVEYKLDMDGGRAVMPAFCLPFSRFAGLYLKPFAVARLAYAALLCLVGVAIVTNIIYNKALTSAQKGQTTLPTILLCSVTYLVILLARPHNVILFALFAMQMKLWILWQQKILSSESPSPKFANHFTLIVLEHMSFFALGNSNSLASIDISHAYTGVNRYDEVTVGLLTFIANWAGPIWWAFAGIVIHNQVFNVDKIASKEKDSIRNNLFGRTLLEYLFDSTLFYSIVLLSLSIAVTILKTHLFIWTVFSPKYLYQMIWNVLFHFFVEVCGGALVNMLLMK